MVRVGQMVGKRGKGVELTDEERRAICACDASLAKEKPWIGFDLDGTLAHYDGFKGWDKIGKPIKSTCDLVKRLHKEGKRIKIFTARASKKSCDLSEVPRKRVEDVIRDWCEKNLGIRDIEITSEKDCYCEAYYDDIAIAVPMNKGVSEGK